VTRIVLLIMLFILVPSLIVSAAVKPENIMGMWFFDEGKGDTAVDSSGNKNDGTITSVKWTDGKYGKALLFEGAGGVKINSAETLNLGDQFTMMAFFNAKTLNNYHAIMCKNNEYLLRMDNLAEGGKMSAFVNLTNNWEPRASAFVPVKDTWYHYAAVYSSKTKQLTVYVNGEQAGQSGRDGKPNPNQDPVNIGNWGGGSNFLGIIDDVAIFNVAVSPEDVKAISENGLKAALGSKSVDSSGKLATTWGDVKYR
jgi:hypothetical protein